MSEMSSGNGFDETEENGLDHPQSFDEEENKFKSINIIGIVRRKSDNSSQNISTIQSSTSKSESILDVKLFIIELVRQFRGILNPKLNCFKDTRQRKTIETKLMQLLVKAFKNLDLQYC